MKGAEGFEGSVKFTLDTPGTTPVFVKNVPFQICYSGAWIGERSIAVVKAEETSTTMNQMYRHQNQSQNGHKLNFKLTCLPIYQIPDESKILKNFAKTEATDAAFLVAGNTIHVNRSVGGYCTLTYILLFPVLIISLQIL